MYESWCRQPARLASLVCLFSIAALPLVAQQDTSLAQSRRRLDQIRAQRDSLEAAQRNLEGRVTDVGAKLRDLQNERDVAGSIVNEIERQINKLGSNLDHSAAELVLAQDDLAAKRAILDRRLADIYKRGPLYTFQVLLTAESFGDLLTRYKYLYLTSRQDRSLVDTVTQLTANVQRQRDQLLGVKGQLDQTRQEHEAEMQRYAELADASQAALRDLQRSAQQNKQKLTTLERNEAQINDAIARFERTNPTTSKAARPGDVPAAGALTTAALGKLDWPVDGEILYEFGPKALPGGGVIRHNGIAIAAPAGTPVKAVEAGTVQIVERIGTYGLSVMVRHTNGYWSLYMQLKTATVKVGQLVTRGQVVGTVGGENSEEKRPNLYFEIRGDNQIALDPEVWLKRRGSN